MNSNPGSRIFAQALFATFLAGIGQAQSTSQVRIGSVPANGTFLVDAVRVKNFETLGEII